MMINPIIQDIQNKIYKKGENCLIVVVGEVRSGKSLCGGITLGTDIDPRFSVSKSMTFEMDEFYEIISNPKMTKRVVVIEEMGLKADKTRFMSTQNKIITHTFMIFGYKQLCIIMTVPSMSYIDSRIEHLINYVFEAKKSYKDGDLLRKTKFKLKRYIHNPIVGKTYKKRPLFWVAGKKVIIPYITLKAPPEDIIQEYKIREKKYKDYTTKNLGIELAINKIKDKSEEIIQTDKSIIDEILKKKNEYLTNYKGHLHMSPKLLMGIFKLSRHRSESIAAVINHQLRHSPPPITISV